MKKIVKKQDGNVLVLTSLSFIVLLLMTGLVIDGGMLFMTKSHLQKVANAAVLSGGQELPYEENQVRTVINHIMTAHNEADSLEEVYIEPNHKIRVQLVKPVKLNFLRLLGIEHIDVRAKATARLGVMGRAVGVAPLGIDESIPLEFGKSYSLKVSSDSVDTGNFGIFALEAPGASTYEDNLRNGYQAELKVGDIVDTQTGNVAGKTQTVINEKVNSCSDMYQRDCSRVILVIVYKPYNQVTNQLKQVEVTGFAYFYVTEQMSNNDTSITGVFIKKADTGFEFSNAQNKGAYIVRLSE
ncbi:Tad domain-containing protein [Litchfieldia alkalitelluris]|uniref:Tad domain-containing protein n=1 Tax=Litchfieldia alkalitelluris TaxID=304268 RepID=UPI001F395D53|nr:Tad domain-containing protein [Litchfieldia alkalitelluris]